MKPTFKNKEEYLQWRTQWRARYKEISHDIRHLRLLCSAYSSGFELPRWDRCRPAFLEIRKKYTNKETGVFNLHGQLWKLRREAIQMLEWRKESKLLAQKQYLELRQAYSSPA